MNAAILPDGLGRGGRSEASVRVWMPGDADLLSTGHCQC